MTPKRFFLFWLADYITASLFVLVLPAAALMIWDLPWLTNAALLFVPLSTLVFARYAFHRGISRTADHRFITASAWVILSFLVDVLLGFLLYRINPFPALLATVPLALYGGKFLAVYLGVYLGEKNMFKNELSAEGGMPSQRSA